MADDQRIRALTEGAKAHRTLAENLQVGAGRLAGNERYWSMAREHEIIAETLEAAIKAGTEPPAALQSEGVVIGDSPPTT